MLRLGMVALQVKDLDFMTSFYSKIIGLSILRQEDQRVVLGVKTGTPLLELLQVDGEKGLSFGLYHHAILLPSQADLGTLLNYLLQLNIPLQGGSDHGYSQALYLSDPEGNGIELYWDKPETEWDIREDGRILGVTEALDAHALLSLAQEVKEDYQLPEGTRMGHIHLSVKDAKSSSELYQSVFGMTEKAGLPGASWIAEGGYHHHLAFNNWEKIGRSGRQVNQLGLAYFSLHYPDLNVFAAIKERALQAGMGVIKEESTSFIVEDSDGIRCKVVLD